MPASAETRRQTLEVLRALAGGPPWSGDLLAQPSPALLQSLEREGLLAHLDVRLGVRPDPTAAGERAVPIDSGAARDAARRAAERNLFGLATLAVVHRAFDRAGIAHLAFKGPVLNQALYGSRARRVYGDLDILVRRDDREPAAAALVGLSFRASSRQGLLAALARRVHFHAAFGPPAQGELLPVELHWELLDRVNLLRFDLDEIFAAAERQTVGGAQVAVLDPAAHLLYLCCHLRKHGARIRWGMRADLAAEELCREERGFPLAWLLDLHGFFLLAADRQAPGRVARLVREWNVEEEVADCVGLLSRVMPSEQRVAAIARLGLATLPPAGPGSTRSRVLATLLASRAGRLAFARGARLNAAWFFRPIRLLDLPRVLAPSPSRLRAFHRDSRTALPRLYARHAVVLFRRLLDLRPSRI